MKTILTHLECGKAAMVVAARHIALTQEPDCTAMYNLGRPINIYPIPRGGVPAAYLLAAYLLAGILDCNFVDTPESADVIVDDLIDSGATMRSYLHRNQRAVCAVLFAKPNYPAHFDLSHLFIYGAKKPAEEWLVFPWEGSLAGSGEDIGVRLLQFIGEDPSREGLRETPARFLKAWAHWSSGYGKNPADVMKVFEDGAAGCDEMVVVKNIPVWSHCEHHICPVFGTATVAYIPNGKIIGLSKVIRLVDIFARRLQVQERLGNQVVDALMEHLQPLGCGIVLRLRHLCMESRGVETMGSETVTSALRGVFKTQPETRAEFLSLEQH